MSTVLKDRWRATLQARYMINNTDKRSNGSLPILGLGKLANGEDVDTASSAQPSARFITTLSRPT